MSLARALVLGGAGEVGEVIVRLAKRGDGSGETLTLTGHAQAQAFR